MNALVIGYGSIGQRHARILTELGVKVSVVSQRQIDYPCAYSKVAEAINAEKPDYIIISNKTSEHYNTLRELENIGYDGLVLVEKPVFDKDYDCIPQFSPDIYVAYNLRFHPLIRELYSLLQTQDIISVHAYVGQYLPTWRPHQDYRLGYSAKSAEGGGVLRDLSHELDFLMWILGDWKRLTALGGKLSSLEIDSEDIVSILMETAKCPVVSVQLNYIDKFVRRDIVVNTMESTIFVDLVNGIMRINDQTHHVNVNRDDTYRSQHEAVLNQDTSVLCTYQHGIKVVQTIEAIEDAIQSKRWILK